MRLYIVRHGKATEDSRPLADFPRPEGYPDDFDRPLTSRGESQARFLAAHLSTPEHVPGIVLTSRYPRAIQTAEIIRTTLNVQLRTARELEVDHPVAEAIDLLDRHADLRSVLLVGHNPQVGELVGLLGASLGPDDAILRTGELVALELKPGHPVRSGRMVLRLRMGEEIRSASLHTAR